MIIHQNMIYDVFFSFSLWTSCKCRLQAFAKSRDGDIGRWAEHTFAGGVATGFPRWKTGSPWEAKGERRGWKFPQDIDGHRYFWKIYFINIQYSSIFILTFHLKSFGQHDFNRFHGIFHLQAVIVRDHHGCLGVGSQVALGGKRRGRTSEGAKERSKLWSGAKERGYVVLSLGCTGV